MVRLTITNLQPSVTKEDLSELFNLGTDDCSVEVTTEGDETKAVVKVPEEKVNGIYEFQGREFQDRDLDIQREKSEWGDELDPTIMYYSSGGKEGVEVKEKYESSDSVKDVYEDAYDSGRFLVGYKDESRSQVFQVFGQILERTGLRTAFLDNAYRKIYLDNDWGSCEYLKEPNICIIRRCFWTNISPLEFVARRYASGSYLERNPAVAEGYRFDEVLVECFHNAYTESLKTYQEVSGIYPVEIEDESKNKTELWSREKVISANMAEGDEFKIDDHGLDILIENVRAIFEVLERVWLPLGCHLVDLKIKYGRYRDDLVYGSNFIDQRSWTLWPAGDTRLTQDKQNSKTGESKLTLAMMTDEWYKEISQTISPKSTSMVAVIVDSTSVLNDGLEIMRIIDSYQIRCEVHRISGREDTRRLMKFMRTYDSENVVYISVGAGLEKIANNTCAPIINFLPDSDDDDERKGNRTGNLTGLSSGSVKDSALSALKIIGLRDPVVWGQLRVNRLKNLLEEMKEEKEVREKYIWEEKESPYFYREPVLL